MFHAKYTYTLYHCVQAAGYVYMSGIVFHLNRRVMLNSAFIELFFHRPELRPSQLRHSGVFAHRRLAAIPFPLVVSRNFTV